MKKYFLLIIMFALGSLALVGGSATTSQVSRVWIRAGATLPASCSNLTILYNLTATHGANAPGIYRCNGTNYVSSAGAAGVTTFNTRTGAVTLSSVDVTDALTVDDALNTIANVLNLKHLDSTESAASGKGVGMGFAASNADGGELAQGRIATVWTDAAEDTEDADFVFSLTTAGALIAEKARLKSTGRFSITGDEAYGSGWNGSLEVPTKNAVYDKLQSQVVSAGTISLSGTSSASHTFAVAYGVAPICVVTPTSDIGDGLSFWVTSTTTEVTVEITSALTVDFRFICHPSAN